MTSPYRLDNPFAPKQSRYRADNPFAAEAEEEQPRRSLGGMVKAAAKLAVAPFTFPTTETGKGFTREFVNSASLGWGEEAEAVAEGALGLGTIGEHLERIRGKRQEFRAEHPVLATHGEVLGGVGVGVPGVSALMKGAKGPVSQALRLAGAGAGTGAVAGAGMAEEGSRLKGAAIGAGVGAVAAPVIGGGAALLPKLGRLMGITTQGGRSQAALKAVNDAVERSGQTMEEVTARAEALVAQGKTPTLLEALGPGGRTALDAMAPLGNEAAGHAAQAARAAPKGEVAQALARASRRPTAKVGISPFGPKLGMVEKAATLGLRRSASKESEALLGQLLDPASKTFPGRVVGKIEPKPTIAEALAERQAANPETIKESALRIPGEGTFTGRTHYDAVRAMQEKGLDIGKFEPEDGFITSTGRFVSRNEAAKIAGFGGGELDATYLTQPEKYTPALHARSVAPQKIYRASGVGPAPEIPASGYEPNANPVRESEDFIARKLKFQGISTPKTKAPIVGSPKVEGEPSEEELRALAEHLMANQDDNLETLLQLSLQKKKGPISSLLGKAKNLLGNERGMAGIPSSGRSGEKVGMSIGAKTKAEALERHIRVTASGIEADGSDLPFFTQRHVSDDPPHIAEARLAKAREIIEREGHVMRQTSPGTFAAYKGGGGKATASTERAGVDPDLAKDVHAPRVEWDAADLQDKGGLAGVTKEFAKKGENVYRALIPIDQISKPRLAGGRTGYEWRELQRGGSPPPIKVRVQRNGTVSVLDGNHRLSYWDEQGYSDIPAWVVDSRRTKLPGNQRGALGVEGAKPPPLPDKIANPTDPYAEITQSAGPETPELARVKLLRKTLGMKGKIDPAILMLLGTGAASGGALTAALALRRRGKRQQAHANRP